MSKKKLIKNIFNKIKLVISIIVFLLAAYVFTVAIIARIKNEVPRIFGYSFHLVVSDSMTPELNVGDLVFAKQIDKSEIVIGDDIVFVSKDPSPQLYGKMIIHRVKAIEPDGSFVTTGIKIGATEDPYKVTDIEGIFVSKSAFLGKVFMFFSELQNCIFAVIVVVLLYITYKLIRRTIKIAMSKEQAKGGENGQIPGDRDPDAEKKPNDAGRDDTDE